MPDIANRDELERKLARKFGRIGKVWLAKLLEELGDFENLSSAAQAYQKIPPELWDEFGKELGIALAPFFEDVFLQQAQEVIEQTTIGIDWSIVNQDAIEWARNYTFRLVKDLTNTSQRTLQSALSAYFERGQSIGELERRLAGIFGPVRAEMIAVTEVTRSASQGELAVAKRLKEHGIEMRKVWQTNKDELVCPICSPLQGKEEGEWRAVSPDGPPAHPRCRCFISLLLPKVINA